ncbi:MAG: glycine/sarcosine/betaine reductase selenoprotein B family protein [Minwuia sp.]|nr:glycine/sarcosine/betaine reductase selenoprotein B family protein [Minwuia sp.]
MEPVKYVDRLNEKYQSLGFPPYQWTINEDAPITKLTKPLSDCCVSMLTTSGASCRGVPGFDPDARNDLRLDEIASDWPEDGFEINDNYYDHTDASADINCQFPIQRLRELAADGVIGQVAPRLWSGFMGRIYKRTATLEKAAELIAELKADGVDLLVLVPACPLDHQTAGLVARAVEEAGIPTVLVSTGRDLSAQVKPPRTVFVNFPMGNAFGRPEDAAQQRRILEDALNLAATGTTAGELVDLPYVWGEEVTVFFKQTTREYQLRK